MFADRAQFDFGSYPPNSTYFDATNDKLIGKFKDETSGDPILEFIGLRPKMYSFITVSDENNAVGAIQKEKHRAKGIQFAAQRALRHRDYAQQLDQPTITSLANRRIGAKSHRLFTIETDKRALCSYDDKRFLLDDNITSLAYGHKDIPAGALETIEEEGDDADLVTVQQPRAADESDQEDDSELNNIETGSAAGPSTSSTVCSSFICAFIIFFIKCDCRIHCISHFKQSRSDQQHSSKRTINSLDASASAWLAESEDCAPPVRRMRVDEAPTPPRCPSTFAECETDEEMIDLVDEITSRRTRF